METVTDNLLEFLSLQKFDDAKKMIDPGRVDHALRVACDIRDTGKKHDQGDWGRFKDDGTSCGSAACLIGWMGQDPACRDIGLTCYGDGPEFRGEFEDAEYEFFIRDEFLGAAIPLSVTDILGSAIYRFDASIDDVIAGLEFIREAIG